MAHLTIHWAYTDVGDDPNGKLLAKFREGLDKWAGRRGFPLTCIWARERMSGGQSEVAHCHLLFYLPMEYRTGKKLREVEAAIYRLIDKHGDGYWADEVSNLVIHNNPDGKYLIKGGGPKVWKRFRLRKEHRRSQGSIHCKRCGGPRRTSDRQRAGAGRASRTKRKGCASGGAHLWLPGNDTRASYCSSAALRWPRKRKSEVGKLRALGSTRSAGLVTLT